MATVTSKMSTKLAYKTNFKIDLGPLTLDSSLKKTLYYPMLVNTGLNNHGTNH